VTRHLAPLLLCALAACARAPQAPPAPPVFYPLPPDLPRVQYLTSIASTADIPRRRSGLADFLLGPEQGGTRIVKPYGVAMRGSKLYVCDTILNSVLVFDLEAGTLKPLSAHRGGDTLDNPINITIADDGTKYVADTERGQVVVYGSDDRYQTSLGAKDEAAPGDVAISGDRLFVTDTASSEVEIWDRATGARTGMLGGPGNGPGQFHVPTNIALAPDGSLYISDTMNFRIQHLSADGEVLRTFGQVGNAFGNFARPKGVAVDPEGRVYVVDAAFNNVQIFDPAGRLLMFLGGSGEDRSNLDLPAAVAIVTDPVSIAFFQPFVAEGRRLSHLILVSSQFGEPRINIYGFLAPPAGAQPASP
jgi:sugar lactone lactonase YvrE